MAEPDWIEGLICFCAREQIVSQVIDGTEAAWSKLCRGRPFPARADIDPLDFRQVLPYLSIVELHEHPFRIRYRVLGTEVARFAGEDFSGKWLSETGWSPLHQKLNHMIYARAHETRRPVFGLSQVDWLDRKDHFFPWGLFPLGEDGRATHCLSVDDFTNIARPSGLLRESSPKDVPE
ncbi:PAS domain-containing protein [Dongia rigui]|nr:PAS domain-containing protein [Dongia rigui]